MKFCSLNALVYSKQEDRLPQKTQYKIISSVQILTHNLSPPGLFLRHKRLAEYNMRHLEVSLSQAAGQYYP